MITQLTPEQEKQIDVYYKRWLNIGLNCEPINKEKLIDLIKRLYTNLEQNIPEIIFCNSPKACLDIAKKRKLNIEDVDWFCGQTYASWMGYYSYFHDVFDFKTKDEELYYLIHDLIIESHWMLPYDDICIVSERPKYILFNDEELHADLKPAIKYKDGFGIYCLNGVRMPKEIVMSPAEELNVEEILAIENVEIRMEGIKKVGLLNLLDKLNSEILDEDIRMMNITPEVQKEVHYVLYNIEIMENKIRPFLKMNCTSDGDIHLEGVDEKCVTVDQALGFRHPLVPEEEWSQVDYKYTHPIILT